MYFGNLPVIDYQTNIKKGAPKSNLVTNIFFRTKFLESIKNQSVSYYLYSIRDQDTPESVAYKYYGDAEAHWCILLVNDIVDPFYDWCLSTKNFSAFIKDKYGSIAYAKTNIHHYEKVIRSRDTKTNLWTERSQEIDLIDARTIDAETLPHDDFTTMAGESFPNVSGVFKDGSSVEVVISKRSVTYYDWEDGLNEKKRNIKLIRKDYYPQIQEELAAFNSARQPFFREIRAY